MLNPAFAAAMAGHGSDGDFMYNLIWQSVAMCRPGQALILCGERIGLRLTAPNARTRSPLAKRAAGVAYGRATPAPFSP